MWQRHVTALVGLLLKPLHERAAKLARQIQYFVIEHVRRELNSDADALANIALDQASERRTTKSETAKPVQALQGDSQLTAANGSAELSRTSSNSARSSLKIHARFQNGVFVPTEPLDLPEGIEVTLDVCK